MAFTLLFASAPATSTPFKTVNISDAEHLKEYLCSSKRTIPPYTHLVIKQLDRHVELNNTGMVCLVENTTDIYISAWRDDSAKDQSPVIVYCVDGGGGFGFFNVTNLTMESVQFRDCGWWGIPADVTKYINGSDQFLYYSVAQTVFLFNHCSNLKLYNVLGNKGDIGNISTLGVNLCGWSNITSVIPDGDLPDTPLSTVSPSITLTAISCHQIQNAISILSLMCSLVIVISISTRILVITLSECLFVRLEILLCTLRSRISK